MLRQYSGLDKEAWFYDGETNSDPGLARTETAKQGIALGDLQSGINRQKINAYHCSSSANPETSKKQS